MNGYWVVGYMSNFTDWIIIWKQNDKYWSYYIDTKTNQKKNLIETDRETEA